MPMKAGIMWAAGTFSFVFTRPCSSLGGARIEQASPSDVAARKTSSVTHQMVKNGFGLETHSPCSSLRLKTGVTAWSVPRHGKLSRHGVGTHLLGKRCRMGLWSGRMGVRVKLACNLLGILKGMFLFFISLIDTPEQRRAGLYRTYGLVEACSSYFLSVAHKPQVSQK